jgi:hypothetical protein
VFRGQTGSVSEIEFCTLYVVAERWILGCMQIAHVIAVDLQIGTDKELYLGFSEVISESRNRPVACH